MFAFKVKNTMTTSAIHMFINYINYDTSYSTIIKAWYAK